MNRLSIFAVFLLFLGISCKVDPNLDSLIKDDELKIIVPEGWPEPVYKFENNPISTDVFYLGRELFYDPILSKDNSVSCGSCHQQFVAFAHADHALSHGINGQLGMRNAPALFNLTWHDRLMHDGGVINLEVQPMAPIENPVEMGEKFADVLNKLRASSKYTSLFEKAYGTSEITDSRMLKAMAQFMGLMYSYNSKYDAYVHGDENAEFSDSQKKGLVAFKSKCGTCHKEPLFSDFKFRSIGLSVDPALNDTGRARITGLPEDRYKFKTPSLRNIALTGPYMHDGRYKTLEQCLDHYTDHVDNLVNLDPILVPDTGIKLSAQEKSDIIDFLKTLTDYKFVFDKRFAEPSK